MKTAKMLKIYGRVQGVFFRESMKDEAKRIGVSGWVRNRKDGTVEAFIQGETALVDEMIAWAKVGPSEAKVERLEISEASTDGIVASFKRLETE
jgi:acylphosphatase